MKPQQYSTALETGIAGTGTHAIRLRDAKNAVEVSIVPGLGNAAVAMTVHGKDILYFPESEGPDHRKMGGIPILAPWANRMDRLSFWANDRQYALQPKLGNIKIDPNGLPIHGLVWKQPWDVVEVAADTDSARVTCRFDFSKRP